MGKEIAPFPDMELYEANIPLPERPWTVDGIQAVSDHVLRRNDSTTFVASGRKYNGNREWLLYTDNMNA